MVYQKQGSFRFLILGFGFRPAGNLAGSLLNREIEVIKNLKPKIKNNITWLYLMCDPLLFWHGIPFLHCMFSYSAIQNRSLY